MSERTVKILDVSGNYLDYPDFPVAVVREKKYGKDEPTPEVGEHMIVDPVFNQSVYNNLYGRLMTLIEATTDNYKLKAVKDLFGKELMAWNDEVFRSAWELAQHGDSSSNLYTRNVK